MGLPWMQRYFRNALVAYVSKVVLFQSKAATYNGTSCIKSKINTGNGDCLCNAPMQYYVNFSKKVVYDK